jgi:hypothetical protein
VNYETNYEIEEASEEKISRPTYWLTRFMILRLLGIVYAIAFLVAINQIIPLIGSDGLTPVGNYFTRVSQILGSNGAGFMRLPSVFWWWHSDSALLTAAWIGFILSCVVAVGFANVPILAIHVICTCRSRVVWIRMGNSTYRNRVPRHFSLPFVRYAPLSKKRNSVSHHYFISLVDLSHYAWCGIDKNSW